MIPQIDKHFKTFVKESCEWKFCQRITKFKSKRSIYTTPLKDSLATITRTKFEIWLVDKFAKETIRVELIIWIEFDWFGQFILI